MLVLKKGTFREIATQANLKETQVWKRLSEMEKLGVINNVSDKICTVSGRKVSVWEINLK